MEAVSYIKYLRISPKKLKSIASQVTGMSPGEALDRLFFLKGKREGILAQAIKSAEAIAFNNLKMDKKNLSIKNIEILKGPFFKRWQAVSRGTAHQIKKRTSHIRVVLEEVKHGKKS